MANKRRKRKSASIRLRSVVYHLRHKPGFGVRCYCCGEVVKWEEATLEHIVPRSRGGSDEVDNLAISHGPCNSARGSSGTEHRGIGQLKRRPITRHSFYEIQAAV